MRDTVERITSDWECDCRSELFGINHENEAFLKLVLLANILGYKYVAYGFECPISVAEPAFSFYSNFAHDWQEKFVERHPKHHGSRVAYGKRTSDKFDNHSYYWKRDDFMVEARNNGIVFDRLDKVDGSAGTMSIVGLAGCSVKNTPQLIEDSSVLIRLAAEVLGGRLINKLLPQFRVTLSKQEREYMAWVLDGKTAGDIAEIMQINPSAVEYMQRKLPPLFDRKGIFATAVLAFRMGMLDV